MMMHPTTLQKSKEKQVDHAIRLAEILWQRLSDKGYGLNKTDSAPIDIEKINQVFECWQNTLNHPKAKLDDKRKQRIAKALQHYSVDECQLAIEGCSRTPHNMGENDNKQKYDGIELIFRDAEHVERFINNAYNLPVYTKPATQRTAQRRNNFEGNDFSDE